MVRMREKYDEYDTLLRFFVTLEEAKGARCSESVAVAAAVTDLVFRAAALLVAVAVEGTEGSARF